MADILPSNSLEENLYGSVTKFGASTRVSGTLYSVIRTKVKVRYLLKKLPKLNYCLYIDNYFTSLKLLDQLRRDNIATVGTVHSNRIEKCPLKDASQMKKVDRGFYDFRTDATSGTIVVRWKDNSVVTIASNT